MISINCNDAELTSKLSQSLSLTEAAQNDNIRTLAEKVKSVLGKSAVVQIDELNQSLTIKKVLIG